MAVKTPLVMYNGRPGQLQAADTIAVNTAMTDVRIMTNGEATAIVIGAPVYVFAADTVKKAQANAAATSNGIGIVYDASIANGAAGSIAVDGPVVATAAQWDAVTGQTGGLTPGAVYFLDPATAGKLTTTPPTAVGQSVLEIGTALSATVLGVKVMYPISL
jgi:hypothetical protein